MGVLNFNENNLITGVNIIDGILHWTDDLNEPRQIEISKFKAGSQLTDATIINGREFRHEDITVIKSHPYHSINLELEEYDSSAPGNTNLNNETYITISSILIFNNS